MADMFDDKYGFLNHAFNFRYDKEQNTWMRFDTFEDFPLRLNDPTETPPIFWKQILRVRIY